MDKSMDVKFYNIFSRKLETKSVNIINYIVNECMLLSEIV